MIEELYKRQAYPTGMAEQIERMGATAISISNRGMLGWAERVLALLDAGGYLKHLKEQTELEKTILSEEPNSSHLTRSEILRAHDVNECPLVLA
jgi:hypothetical protein